MNFLLRLANIAASAADAKPTPIPVSFTDSTSLAIKAMAGTITIAEVEHLVEPGELDPNFVHTPGVFIQRIFQGKDYEKRIEQRTVRTR